MSYKVKVLCWNVAKVLLKYVAPAILAFFEGRDELVSNIIF